MKNKQELKSIFDWLSGFVSASDLIIVDNNGKTYGYIFTFPLKAGDAPKKMKSFKMEEASFFIGIESKRKFEVNWQRTFNGYGLELWANKEKITEPLLYPVIFGLSPSDKKLFLHLARKTLEIFLTSGKRPVVKDLMTGQNWPRLLGMKTALSLAIWAKGQLRGLAINKAGNLADNIIDAAIAASRDPKYLPIEKEELPEARLEIIIFSDLLIPVDQENIKRNLIIYDNGYLIESERETPVFLPLRYNTKNLPDLRAYFSEPKAEKKYKIFNFAIQDFIEPMAEEGRAPLDLVGPVVKIEKQPDLLASANAAADWLVNIQEESGNFIPIIDPDYGPVAPVDWPRSGFCGFALAEFGQATGQGKYINAARKNFEFLKKYLLDQNILAGNYDRAALSLAYLGQLALALGDNYIMEAKQAAFKILAMQNTLRFEPIMWAQIGTFSTKLVRMDNNIFSDALRFAKSGLVAYEENLKRTRDMKLAHWAELAHLYLNLFLLAGEVTYLNTFDRILAWLCRYQLATGAFRATDKSEELASVNVRGSGKIAEVLALVYILEGKNIDGKIDLNYYKKCLERVLTWMQSLQYSRNNSFFVPTENLAMVLGGFRENYSNNELWLDGAGHFLVAAARSKSIS